MLPRSDVVRPKRLQSSIRRVADADSNQRERFLLGLVLAFAVTGALLLRACDAAPTICNASVSTTTAALIVLPLTISFGSLHLVLSRRLPTRDPVILPSAAMLTALGLLLVARLAPNFLLRQVAWVVICALALGCVSLMGSDLRWLQRFRYTWLLGGLALLAATLVLGVNPSGYGPRLWLGLGTHYYFQPSELLKLLMVAYVASYLSDKRELVAQRTESGASRLAVLTYIGPLVTMFGIALRAAAEDFDAARLMGVRSNNVIRGAFALSGALAGVAAIFGPGTNIPAAAREILDIVKAKRAAA